jgi:hypothetical protein
MSSKPTRNDATADVEVSYAKERELPQNSTRDEEIRCRAYEIYLERGQQPGAELDDWLQAERELEGAALWRVQAG